jgi:hypothetical protein
MVPGRAPEEGIAREAASSTATVHIARASSSAAFIDQNCPSPGAWSWAAVTMVCEVRQVACQEGCPVRSRQPTNGVQGRSSPWRSADRRMAGPNTTTGPS